MVTIQDLIPQYGELNRIYSEYIVNNVFSFDKQKFITGFYRQHNNSKDFEAAILKLVLDKQKEQYILILKSLKTEIEKNILIYETHTLPDDNIIARVCYDYADKHNLEIEDQLEVTRKLSKSVNEAYNRYDSIGYREHTNEEKVQVEKEYERRKAEYEKAKAELDKLYELQKQDRKEAFQYMENLFDAIYRLSLLFMNILKKYIPDIEKKQEEQNEQDEQQVTSGEQHEYFSMKLLSIIYEVCLEEQFEKISASDFYANMNLHPCKNKLKIKAREKIRVCYLIFLMSEELPKQDKDEWKDKILKLLDIDESYYRSKYKEPVSDFPSDSNQNFAKEMERIFG
ncbi:MAG: hypothetical protein NC410_06990 [Oscillibacter sp.]|nr:hypothetical protein [Oscillibacter sp.]